jgi:hypothetical protein
MNRCALVVVSACVTLLSSSGRAAENETVVLLHGLGRTQISMTRLASALRDDGYRVVNLSYPSRSRTIESLARDWLPQKLRESGADSAARVHFVTHSMGGIVLRVWLRDVAPPRNLGRVVMLAPPNAGSEITDRLNGFAPFRWFTGRNGRRLGTTGAEALPRALCPWPSFAERPPGRGELGIIAGDRSLNPLFSRWLPGPGDGKVTVSATHLTGERDHVVLHASHTWIAWRRETIAQVKTFLRDGHFDRAAPAR